MPEGPEVETVRLGLISLVGKQIQDVLVVDHKKYRPYRPQILALTGSVITDVLRLGKFLVWKFSKPSFALNHLGMTGLWRIYSKEEWSQLELSFSKTSLRKFHKHLKIAFLTKDEIVVFEDVRTFGRFEMFDDENVLFSHKSIADLGPDILDLEFDVDDFIKRIRGKGKTPRRKEIGKVLLDYNVVSGCGNIYKSEALYLSKIHPLTPANQISDINLSVLAANLCKVAQKALANKGSTLRDYNTVDGYNGLMQNEFEVYGRTNEPCTRCETLIEQVRQGDRTSYFCPKCQTRRKI